MDPRGHAMGRGGAGAGHPGGGQPGSPASMSLSSASPSFFSTLRQSVGEAEEMSDFPMELSPRAYDPSADGARTSTRPDSIITLQHHDQPLSSPTSRTPAKSPASSTASALTSSLLSLNFIPSNTRGRDRSLPSQRKPHGNGDADLIVGTDDVYEGDCESPRSKFDGLHNNNSSIHMNGDDEEDDKKELMASIDAAAMASINSREPSVLRRWCPPLRVAGRFLRWCNPNVRDTTLPGSSLIGSWYLSPEQHVLEFLLVNLTFIGLLVYFGMSLIENAAVESSAKPSGTVIMYIIAGMLVLSFLIAIRYKWRTSTMIFLLQPCHVVTTLELLVLLCPRGSYLDMTEVFNVLLFCIWNPLIAVLQPDLRDYKSWLDIFNFFFQHALIILIPFYLLLTRQYDFYAWSWNGLMVSFILQVLYHYIVLELFSIAAGVNLNYMMAPPPGPLQWFKSWYRWIMLSFSFRLTIGQRLLFVDGLWWLLGNTLYDNVFSYLP